MDPCESVVGLVPVIVSPTSAHLYFAGGLVKPFAPRARSITPASCLWFARIRNSSDPTLVIFFLTSSTSSAVALGRITSIRLLPMARIGMSSTPSGLIRRFSAVISSSRLTLPPAVASLRTSYTRIVPPERSMPVLSRSFGGQIARRPSRVRPMISANLAPNFFMVVPCGPAVAILDESRIHAEGFRPLHGGAFPFA